MPALLPGLLAGLASLPLIGFVWQKTAERRDRRRYPPPGELVPGASGPLHVHAAGDGPPVVLEAGIAASSVGWAHVRPKLASFCRVFSYDRPGLAWSPGSSEQRSPERLVADLHAVVRHTGGPVVLVGHSFGALVVRLFAARHPELVRGLVLVDPALLLEWAEPTPGRRRMLGRGVSLSRRGAWLARIGFVRLSLNLLSGGSRALPKLFARMSSGKGAPVTERLVGEVRKLPEALWPVVASHWCRADTFESMAQHLEALPAVAAAVALTSLPPDLPVIVISGGHLQAHQAEEHAGIVRGSRRGKHVVATGSGHWVHLDCPELIAEAVRELL